MIALKIAIAALLWLPAYAMLALLWLLGWPATIAGILSRRMLLIESRNDERPIAVWEQRWLWLWSNDEDGVGGDIEHTNSSSTRRWLEKAARWPWWRRVISWSAWRNPVANLRFSKLGCKLDRAKMRWWGSFNPDQDYKWDRAHGIPPHRIYWCLALQGWRLGVWAMGPRGEASHWRIRMGWKVHPGYLREIDRYVGLTLQASYKRKD